MELLTIQETAALLRVNPITVRRAIAEGRLQALRVGKSVRVRREAVDELLVPFESTPAAKKIAAPQGKPFTMDDPLWDMVGLVRSDGPGDVAERTDTYLAEAYAAKNP